MRWTGSVRALMVALVATLSVAVVAGSPVGAQTGSGGRPGVTSTTIRVGGMAGITNPVGQPYVSGFDGLQAVLQLHQRQGRRVRPQVPARRQARRPVAARPRTSRRPARSSRSRTSSPWRRSSPRSSPARRISRVRVCRRSGGTSTPAGRSATRPRVRSAPPGARRAEPVRGEGLLPVLHLPGGGARLHRPAGRREERRHPRLQCAAVGAVRAGHGSRVQEVRIQRGARRQQPGVRVHGPRLRHRHDEVEERPVRRHLYGCRWRGQRRPGSATSRADEREVLRAAGLRPGHAQQVRA